MATFNFFLRKDKEDTDGKLPVYFRIYTPQKTTDYYTGIRIYGRDWNEDSQRVKASDPSCSVLNNEIERVLIKSKSAYFEQRQNGGVRPDKILECLKGPDKKDFFDYCKSYMDRLKLNGRVRLHKQTNVIKNKIKKYHGSDSGLLLTDIDSEYLDKLKAFIVDEYGNAPNTIVKDFERLRMVFRAAKKDGLMRSNPFEEFDFPARQKSQKTVLTIEQIRNIEALALDEGSVLWHTRNYFLFSFYNAGIRFGDVCKLKRKNIIDGRLKYLMDKTSKNKNPKWKSIKLLPPALKILEAYNYKEKAPSEYLFPIVDLSKDLQDPFVWDREKSSKTALANRDLKEIGELAGIEEDITTHIARHSFANYARKQGMSIYSISKALGHSNLSTTEKYLKSFDEEQLDEEMESLF